MFCILYCLFLITERTPRLLYGLRVLLDYMKYLQAHNNGHDEEGYCNSPNKLCRLRPSLCMVDDANENKECQRHYIEQRKDYFVVY